MIDRNVRINGLQSASSLKYNFTIFTRNSRNLAYPKVVATDEINNNVYNAPGIHPLCGLRQLLLANMLFQITLFYFIGMIHLLLFVVVLPHEVEP